MKILLDKSRALTLKWILSHCSVLGSEAADSGKAGHTKRAGGQVCQLVRGQDQH